MMEQLLRRLNLRQHPVTIPSGGSQETAWAESNLYSGSIPKYTPDDLIGEKGALIYDKMMRDEQVKAVVKFKRDAITARDFSFIIEDRHAGSLDETERQRRIDMYTDMVEHVDGSFTDGLNFIMKATWQGFSMTEKILHTFEFDGHPFVGLKKLSPKPFHTFEFFVDNFGTISKTEQFIDGARQIINLGKFVYFVQNPDRDQHYGQSELREAYRSWYSKDIIIRFYNIFMERMATGFLELKPTGNNVIQKGSDDYNALRAILGSMQSTSGILLPQGIDLTVHAPKTSDQFEKAITTHDLQIAKALLVPNLLGVTHTGQTGSFSQSETQMEAFLWTLDADAMRLQDAVNEQLFDQLSQINFADGIGPKFVFKPVSSSKKHEIIKVWLDLVQAGAVEASDSDEEHIRKLMDFPDKGEPLDLQPEPEAGGGLLPTDPNAQPRSQRPTDGEDRDQNFSRAAFSRATKRVAISVIDRKTTDIVERFSRASSEALTEMVAGIALDIIEHDMGTPGATKRPQDLVFSARERTKLRRITDDYLKQGWDLGIKHAQDEITKARQVSFKVNMARLGDSAGDYLVSIGFRIVGDISDDVLKFVQVILANAIKFSWTPEQSVAKIYDRLTTEGIVFIETNAEVTGRTVSEIREAIASSGGETIHRVKTMVRTSLFESLNEARYSAFTDPELGGFVEALEYSAILDSRTTPICRHLDDRVYPVGADEWDSYRPPNHFNCRSILVPVTTIDEEIVGKDHSSGSRWSKMPRVDPQQGFG